ncbi:hypothetical protein H696_04328 [Fonticula alba]|uniref:Rab5-interacting protein n=1 Tax=Fonticula alba TaxID=691883 RepID=A0A058Z3P6_FONAL|nr:hypothetical protein H696_04328 [Fonticula alba]KCV68909.1 hypothetical protein H696_04328 [Fonticula alba]|eukprot:XP_009496480.1 hypothetical protein H696_04328 [Fonticula alba]
MSSARQRKQNQASAVAAAPDVPAVAPSPATGGAPLTIAQCLSRALAGGSNWEKDELLDTVSVVRIFWSLALGAIWGVLGMSGLVGFLALAAGLVFAPLLFARFHLRIDPELVGFSSGFSDLITEGFAPGMAAAMLAWITLYTAFHSSL